MLSKGSLISLVVASGVLFVGCSTAYKQRQEEKNKVASSTGHYCEFVNGDARNDVDVELTLQMSKKCELAKPYSITNYKNASDIFGVIFCCSYQKNKFPAPAPSKTGAAPAGNGLE